MAKIREIEIDGMTYRFENLRVPMDNYGCVVAALVHIPEFFKNMENEKGD